MDELVLRGMAKWPNVPAVYGWLSLDRRGGWLLEGRPLRHARTIAFINRNYLADAHSAWLFQNGPQRVYVALAYTPWVLHRHPDRPPGAAGALVTHTGGAVERLDGAWVDEEGNLLLETPRGIGLLDDRDLVAYGAAFCDEHGRPPNDAALEAGLAALMDGEAAALGLRDGDRILPVQSIRCAEVPARFGFIQHPAPGAE